MPGRTLFTDVLPGSFCYSNRCPSAKYINHGAVSYTFDKIFHQVFTNYGIDAILKGTTLDCGIVNRRCTRG